MKRTLCLILLFAGVLIFSALAAPQTTIRFALWDYSMDPATQAVVAAFQKENPTIKVEIVDIASNDYSTKMTVMLAAGEDVDAFAIKNFMDYGSYLTRNYLSPIDTYVSKAKFDLTPYGSALEVLKSNKKLMALPFRSDIYVLYYNKDLFDKAKVPYPTNDMTWQQVREAAKKLTSGEANDKIWGYFLHSWRSQVQNTILPTTTTTLVDDKYAFLKPAYDLFLGMQNEDKSLMPLAEVQTTKTHYRAFFESGKVGMLYMGTWYIGSLIQDKKAGKHTVNWGIVKGPRWGKEKNGSSATVLTTAGILAKSKKKDAAWQFISFLGGEKGAKIYAQLGTFPACRTPAVIKVFTATEGFPANADKALETATLVPEMPPHPQSGPIDQTLTEEHNLILTGQKTLDQGLKDMEKRVKEIIED